MCRRLCIARARNEHAAGLPLRYLPTFCSASRLARARLPRYCDGARAARDHPQRRKSRDVRPPTLMRPQTHGVRLGGARARRACRTAPASPPRSQRPMPIDPARTCAPPRALSPQLPDSRRRRGPLGSAGFRAPPPPPRPPRGPDTAHACRRAGSERVLARVRRARPPIRARPAARPAGGGASDSRWRRGNVGGRGLGARTCARSSPPAPISRGLVNIAGGPSPRRRASGGGPWRARERRGGAWGWRVRSPRTPNRKRVPSCVGACGAPISPTQISTRAQRPCVRVSRATLPAPLLAGFDRRVSYFTVRTWPRTPWSSGGSGGTRAGGRDWGAVGRACVFRETHMRRLVIAISAAAHWRPPPRAPAVTVSWARAASIACAVFM